MHFRRYRDTISGIVIIVFAIALYVSASNISTSIISVYGATLIPVIIALVLFLLGGFILWDGIKTLHAMSREKTSGGKKTDALAVVATFLLMGLYVTLMEGLGYLLSTLFYLFGQMFILSGFNKKKLWLYGLLAVTAAPLIYFLFRNVFHLLLPQGLLGRV